MITERIRAWACLGALLVASAAPVLAGNDKAKEPYALIFGTVYGPDERPMYGVHVKIRRAGEKKAQWEQYSDHQGEFAQRVPAGAADYVVWTALKPKKGRPQPIEVKVHVENDERVDVGLHLKQ